MNVIFLDIDGVLNYEGSRTITPEGTYFVEDDKLKLLQEMIEVTGAELVLSSSWRRGWILTPGDNKKQRSALDRSRDYFMLCAKLHDFGLSLLSEIPRLPEGNREDAINYWLREWPGEPIENYVILDDEADKFSSGNPHLVLTSVERGLQERHILEVQKLLHAEESRLRKKQILIVDDAETNRAVLKALLDSEYRVLEAKEGREALEIMEENTGIALVITDIQMPGMNGTDLIRNIRKQKRFDHVAIIANTQFGDPEQEEEILDLGANDFVYKPSTPKIIRLRVKNAMLLNSRMTKLDGGFRGN